MGGGLDGRGSLIEVPGGSGRAIHGLGTAQAGALDSAAAEVGVDTGALMAVAGFQCARLARQLLGEAAPGPVAVLAGRGNNGGDALALARHLGDWGLEVRVVLVGAAGTLTALAARQWTAVGAAELGAEAADTAAATARLVARALRGARLAVDGLLGTGARGVPREPVASAIRGLLATRPDLVLSIDVPSGLDADRGLAGDPCVVASDTAMLGAVKAGCLAAGAATVTGTLWLADIGIPAAAYRRVAAAPPPRRDGEWRVVER